jgi:peroxiredoxin
MVLFLLPVSLLLASCGDNLFPSGRDMRPAVEPGTIGSSVGQKAPDFSATDSTVAAVSLTSALASRKGIVLYFTMWCPICDSHMSHMRGTMASFPQIGFYAVDYVSGSVADAAGSAMANGFASSFMVLADTRQALLGMFQATMGTTVVIGNDGTVRMNEDYRDGARLAGILAGL